MAKRTRSRRAPAGRQARMVFERRNYQLLLLGVALVVVGFAIMRIENAVDGFISLYVSPLLILAGYVGVAVAILWRPDASATEEPAAR